jgi:hypothetical protein
MHLTRFWIRFRSIPPYNSLRMGCGVTAYSYEDALSILRETVFKDEDMPLVEDAIENIDISTLDQKHIIPNMEAPVWRGVWYPRGFTFLR